MDDACLQTLHALYLAPRTVQSDFARENAAQVAALASLGLISTKESKDTFGRLWRPTPPGLNTLIANGYL